MKRHFFANLIVLALLSACGSSQKTPPAVAELPPPPVEIVDEAIAIEEGPQTLPVYRATETQLTDLVHTKLEVNFNWAESEMNGIATITAKPHFYPSDSLILDAKGMRINSVKMNGQPLKYEYANDFLKIKLGKTFTRKENYTVVIDYVARPEKRETQGSAAITSDKGLYFINPTGADPNKFTHLWTQGETEASSVWFPTIDAPNSKTTQEIFMTVNDRYKTLSNGKFMGAKKNADGTRTDHWKQDLPHAPYLFMMAVGEFAIVEDSYTKKNGTKIPVNYYVEKDWAPYAKAIFGETPKMIRFFSDLLDFEYPWDKYHQVVVRDYVSGAMENTGAVVFGEFVYKTDRELLDDDDNSTIAHELFHHWFGDLVTCESWSNLTLNESFANYSQYLWDEHRYGLDEADYQAQQEANGYYQSAQMQGYHDLVWFAYENREQMFDGHSYNKGGRILHMLRNYLGDEAFFEGIRLYLKQNQYKAAEYHHLRLAMEAVSGEDLNWFFHQWYESSGHPILEVRQSMKGQNLELAVSQQQDLEQFPLFRLPVHLAITDDGGQRIEKIVIDQSPQTFTFPITGNLKSVVFDHQQMLLAKVNEQKPVDQWIYQYFNQNRFVARQQALEQGVKMGNPASEKLVITALNDEFWKIRTMAIDKSSALTGENKEKALAIIKNLALSDAKSQVRSQAVAYVAANETGEELDKFLSKITASDPSYLVLSSALKGYAKSDPEKAMTEAKKLEGEKSPKMISGIAQIYGMYGGAEQAAFFQQQLLGNQLTGFDQLATLNSFTMLNSRLEVADIRGNVKVYQHLAKEGGFYTKMFLPRNTEYLIRELSDRLGEYEEADLNNFSAQEKDRYNRDVALLNQTIEDLKSVQTAE